MKKTIILTSEQSNAINKSLASGDVEGLFKQLADYAVENQITVPFMVIARFIACAVTIEPNEQEGYNNAR